MVCGCIPKKKKKSERQSTSVYSDDSETIYVQGEHIYPRASFSSFKNRKIEVGDDVTLTHEPGLPQPVSEYGAQRVHSPTTPTTDGGSENGYGFLMDSSSEGERKSLYGKNEQKFGEENANDDSFFMGILSDPASGVDTNTANETESEERRGRIRTGIEEEKRRRLSSEESKHVTNSSLNMISGTMSFGSQLLSPRAEDGGPHKKISVADGNLRLPTGTFDKHEGLENDLGKPTKKKRHRSKMKPPTDPMSPQSTRSRKPGGDVTNQAFQRRMEEEVLESLSFIRENPDKVILLLEKKKKYFRGKDYILGPGRVLVTEEGVAAVDDAINFLKTQQPLPHISTVSDPGLSLACADHVHDNGQTGSLKHIGSDGSKPHHRIGRYGKWRELCGECLWFGSCQSGLEMMLDLIIDDGVPDRGHRKCIFTPSYTVVGVKLGPHVTMEMMLALDFSNAYTSDEEKIKKRTNEGPPPVDPAMIPKFDLPTCDGCKKSIVGPVVEYRGQKLHRGCFSCLKCGTSLVGVPCMSYQDQRSCQNCLPNSIKLEMKRDWKGALRTRSSKKQKTRNS